MENEFRNAHEDNQIHLLRQNAKRMEAELEQAKSLQRISNLEMEKCHYEAHVEKFFGLPDSITEGAKVDADFGLLVNLLATFESESAQRLGKNLAEAQHSVNTWKSMMRMELRRCEGLVSENLALLKLLRVLQPYVQDLNAENYDRPAAGLYPFDRTLESAAAEVGHICNPQTAVQ